MLALLHILLLLVSQSQAADLVASLSGESTASTLTNLLGKAGLTSALSSGDFTVFAPTDAAFARVPQDVLNDVLSDTTKLKNLLMYHVVSGVTHSANITDDMTATTLSGDKVRLNVYPDNNVVTINGKTISSPDHDADNGVIHYIDNVIMPPANSVFEIQADPITLFAPTNAAFNLMPDSDIAKLRGNPTQLKNLIEYHILPHTVYAAGVYHHEYEESVDYVHDRVHIRKNADGVRVNNAKVTAVDINAKNGVIHKIDHVLIPVRVGFFLRTGKGGVGRK